MTTEKIDLAGLSRLMPSVETIARKAGAEIMALRGNLVDADITTKEDRSPVTAADHAANRVVTESLQALTPDIAIISEESSYDPDEFDADGVFWVVDPLDGTKGFLKGEDRFTVNIALVADHRPVLGVIYVPARDELFAGIVSHDDTDNSTTGLACHVANGGQRRTIEARTPPAAGISIVASGFHGDTNKMASFLTGYNVVEQLKMSGAMKFCLVAKGEADIYPRFGNTCEWDTAAGQAIVEAAGGRVVEAETGKLLTYGHIERKFLNPAFIVWGRKG